MRKLFLLLAFMVSISSLGQNTDPILSVESAVGRGFWNKGSQQIDGDFVLPSSLNNFTNPDLRDYGKLRYDVSTQRIQFTTETEWKALAAISQTITNGVVNNSPSEDAVFDALALKANDNAVVHLTGVEVLTGAKTFLNSSAATGAFFNNNSATSNSSALSIAASTNYGIYASSFGGSAFIKGIVAGVNSVAIDLDGAIGTTGDYLNIKKNGGLLSKIDYLGNITGNSFIKTGGTSSQFLKADGSIDSNIYATTANAILQNGNTFGASMVIGTNDANDVIIERNNTAIFNVQANGIKLDTSSTFKAIYGNTVTSQAIQFASGSDATLDYLATPTGTVVAHRVRKVGAGTGNIVTYYSGGGGTTERAGVRDDGRVYGTDASANNDFYTLGQATTALALKANLSGGNNFSGTQNVTGTVNATKLGVNGATMYDLDTFGVSRTKRIGVNGAGIAAVNLVSTDAKTAGDGILQIYQGHNSSDAEVTYAAIIANVVSPTAGSQSGSLIFRTINNAANVNALTVDPNGKANFIGRVSGSDAVSNNDFVPLGQMNTAIDNRTGWQQVSGNNYTSGSPLVINAGTNANLLNNGATSNITTQLPTGVTSFVNTTTGKITPQNDGDFYIVDIRFKATSSSVDGVIDIGIDIGGAMGIIRQHTISLRKGIGVEQRVALSFPVYSGSTFVTNGGSVNVASVVGNTSIYDVTFVVDRTHKAK